MIRLDLQLFAKGGSGSDGIGAYKRTTKEAIALSGGPGGGSGGGSGGASSGKGSAPETRERTGPVTSLYKDEKYDIYKIRDGKEREYDSGSSYSETRELLRTYQPVGNGIWRDRYGREYRIVRSRR